MNFNKNELKVKGKMTEKGADRAGTIQAFAWLIGSLLFGCASVIYALSVYQG